MRETAGRVYVWGVYLVAVVVAIQFLLAGLGIFTNSQFLFWHAVVNGSIVFFLPIVVVLIGWLGRVPARVFGLCGLIAGLVVLQSLFLIPYHSNAQGVVRAIAGLHVLNALVIAWVTFQLIDRTRAWASRTA